MLRDVTVVSFLAVFLCAVCWAEEVRKPAVAGAFYPADKMQLKESIEDFLKNAEHIDIDGKIIAILTPHAGYEYSGQVAAYGYKQLEGMAFDTVVIISNAHTAHFSGAVIDNSDAWQTPLGTVRVDKDFADKLIGEDSAVYYDNFAHAKDHTIETQIPFLQTVLKNGFKIVPILFGNMNDEAFKKLAQILSEQLGERDIVVISTDMSHYPGYRDSMWIDTETADIIKQGDISLLEKHVGDVMGKGVPNEVTLCCGIDAVKAMMRLGNILGAERKVLKYANSGDVIIGDRSRVVGYISIVMFVPENRVQGKEIAMKQEYLSKEEKKKLFEIAKLSVIEAVTGKKQFLPQVTEPRLQENCGAFVTINKHGQLRGCIGYITAVRPLYETIKDVAKSAAINDHRFTPVSEEELDDLELEISVLTPLEQIADVSEIEVGRHGIYMKKGLYSGILLPQVATEYGWDRKTFLEQTCRKAGLPKDAWKNKSTEIYIYSAEVYGEGDIK